MKRLILFGVLYAAMLILARTAGAQTNWFGADSSEYKSSTIAGPIGSGATPPFRILVHSGEGGKFANCGFPLLLTLAPAPGSESASSLREEIWISAVSGDTLTVIARKTSNTPQLAWSSGSYIGIRVSMQIMRQLQDSARRVRRQLDSLLTVIGPNSFLPSQTGNAGKTLTTNGSSLAWTMQPGSVVPVSLGGTGLTTLPAGKMLYAPTTGTIAALSIGSGLSIAGGILSASLAASTTDDLPEGSTNLYYTDARVRSALSAASPLEFSGGVFSMPEVSSIQAGWMSPAVLNVLMAKQAALTFPLAASLGGTGTSTLAAALNAMFVASGADTTGTGDTVVLGKTHAGYRWVGIGGGGGGAGTVTSIGIDSIANVLTWSPASISTSGTFMPTLDDQIANKLFAGPASGANAPPTFRTMVTADIPNSLVTNAKLANASVTVTAGSGLSGGGSVALGSSVTLTNAGVTSNVAGTGISVSGATGAVTITNAGVTSIAGTANQIIASASTGGITLSTPQSIATTSDVQFDSVKLTKPLMPVNGGTGQTALLNHGVLVGAGTAGVTSLAVASTNTVLHGNTAADPSWSAIGTSDIGDSTVTGVKIATGAVSLAKQVYGQLPTANIADSNVTAVKIATGAVSLAKQVSGQLPTANIADSNVTAVKIATGAVSLTKQVSGQLPTANIADSNVTAVKIATGAVSLTKQVSGQLPTANIADSNVTAVKIATSAVSLTKQVSGVLPVANGGTGQSSYTDGQLLIGNTSGNTLAKATLTGTSNQVTVTNGGGSITLSLPNTIHFANSATTVDVAATSSGTDGRNFVVKAGSTGGGTDQSGGALLLEGGDATGAGFGGVQFYAPYTGSTGTTARAASLVAAFDGNDGVPRLTLGANSPSHGSGYIQFADGTSRYYTLQPPAGALGASYVATLPSATGTLALTSATGGGTGQTSYTTGDMLYASGSTALSKLAIGTSGYILSSSGSAPTWTTSPTLGSLTVTNAATFNGSLNVHVSATKTTTYTILATDHDVVCDATSAGFTATLPLGASTGDVVVVIKLDGSANAVTVAPAGGQSIIAGTGILSGGNVTLDLTTRSCELHYIGTNNWTLISRD